jgi:hypothetical protein
MMVARASLTQDRFGKLRLYGTVRVGKDRQSWQELECYLFAEMLICVKEKKGAPPPEADGDSHRKLTRCTLKGSILIKKHLKHVECGVGEFAHEAFVWSWRKADGSGQTSPS